MKLRALLLVTAFTCFTPFAFATHFAGTWDITLYGDTNISDGVTIGSSSATLELTTSDSILYTAELTSGESTASYTMNRNNSLLSLTPQPAEFDTWTLCNSYMFSDGSNGAFLLMGQDSPADISINVSGWTDAVSPVLLSDITGVWSLNVVEDWNLRSDPLEAFTLSTRQLTISDAGNGQANVDIELTSDEGMQQLLMNFDGNILTPASQPDNCILSHFAIYTDGQGLALARIATELDDATDVSVTIGLGQPVPEPATLSILALGGLMVLRRQKCDV
ncbi:MAG: PEP-CTERM sorting domain-containing protein [Planctomycetes bacterium]|nr:PEP-CTERM sorting domain-containing protein [Planctomycetota bacterium]